MTNLGQLDDLVGDYASARADESAVNVAACG